jgi:hypothetical protein
VEFSKVKSFDDVSALKCRYTWVVTSISTFWT